jgi:hypothetical protein
MHREKNYLQLVLRNDYITVIRLDTFFSVGINHRHVTKQCKLHYNFFLEKCKCSWETRGKVQMSLLNCEVK